MLCLRGVFKNATIRVLNEVIKGDDKFGRIKVLSELSCFTTVLYEDMNYF